MFDSQLGSWDNLRISQENYDPFNQCVIYCIYKLKFVKDSEPHKNISKNKRRCLNFSQLTDFVPVLPSYRSQSFRFAVQIN